MSQRDRSRTRDALSPHSPQYRELGEMIDQMMRDYSEASSHAYSDDVKTLAKKELDRMFLIFSLCEQSASNPDKLSRPAAEAAFHYMWCARVGLDRMRRSSPNVDVATLDRLYGLWEWQLTQQQQQQRDSSSLESCRANLFGDDNEESQDTANTTRPATDMQFEMIKVNDDATGDGSGTKTNGEIETAPANDQGTTAQSQGEVNDDASDTNGEIETARANGQGEVGGLLNPICGTGDSNSTYTNN